jgi:hypothetical protein
MKRNVCEEKGGKVPEAQVGRCIRSKEKGLLDKYDGLATAAGSETRPRYYIQYRHATMNETRGISSAEHYPLRTAEGGQGVVASGRRVRGRLAEAPASGGRDQRAPYVGGS